MTLTSLSGLCRRLLPMSRINERRASVAMDGRFFTVILWSLLLGEKVFVAIHGHIGREELVECKFRGFWLYVSLGVGCLLTET